MATYSKELLSTSTEGEPTLSTSTSAGSPTTIHDTTTTGTTIDELWLYCSNSHSADVELILFYGYDAAGSVPTAPANTLYQTISTKAGMTLVVAGLILVNDDTNATRVSAYDATGSVLNLWGYVNRITA
jgi:cytoskeletal protein RodZ